MALQARLAVNTLVKTARDEFKDASAPFDVEAYEIVLAEHPEYPIVLLRCLLGQMTLEEAEAELARQTDTITQEYLLALQARLDALYDMQRAR
ncbi:MAG: hypothetical protein A3B31_03060 [Candidatus Komeilibacteria bacterium RIFCSPLOWO2_01_FULL_53_11]|uniref:Uncharacterized protein n=1 Tax=Candidatus Komeilibacteria bacterium RIFCSPLOWO2_01_FULL_53_11 TaxID=1798552 RepID=A0A1G2BQ62_9BACT|nr:MAG: hypothetical protein A3B31_03060 [Candidatus Komeilibacteria bacterium RIFCSPLOWO2_01_FULL_53_11]